MDHVITIYHLHLLFLHLETLLMIMVEQPYDKNTKQESEYGQNGTKVANTSRLFIQAQK